MAEWLACWAQQWMVNKHMSLIFWSSRFEHGIQPMKRFAHNWHSPYCQCVNTCSHVSSIRKWYLYAQCLVCKQPSGIFSCPESTHCCDRRVIPHGSCQSVFGVMAEWLACWTQLWVANRCVWGFVAPGSKLASCSRSNSLIIDIYLIASARRHVLVSPPHKNDINEKINIYIYTHKNTHKGGCRIL